MNKLLTLLLVATAITSKAQPVLQSADIFPTGASATVSVTSSMTPATGGADQTWDFSGIGLTPAIAITAMNPSATPFYSQFGQSNYAWKLDFISSGNVSYNYYDLTSSKFDAVGTGITASTGTDYTPNPKRELKFPLSYNDSFTDTFQTTTDLPETVSYTYDGYGTVILPSETVTNAVRLVRYDDGSTTPSRFLWIRSNPVMLLIDYNISSGQANVISNVVTGIETPSANSGVTIAPNPSHGIFILTGTAAGSTVEVFNVAGQKLIKAASNGEMLIDLSAQPNGMYFYNCKMPNRMVQAGVLVVE